MNLTGPAPEVGLDGEVLKRTVHFSVIRSTATNAMRRACFFVISTQKEPLHQRTMVVISSRPQVVSRNLSFESTRHGSGPRTGKPTKVAAARDFSALVEVTDKERLLRQARRLPAGKRFLHFRRNDKKERRFAAAKRSLLRRDDGWGSPPAKCGWSMCWADRGPSSKDRLPASNLRAPLSQNWERGWR